MEVEQFIFHTAGNVGLAPWDFTFWQLVLMREGAERERWERLSFQLANIAGFAGAKKPELALFNKFDLMAPELASENVDSKSAMASVKNQFFPKG